MTVTAAHEARTLAREAQATTLHLRAEHDLLASLADLCAAVDGLATAVMLLAGDAESTLRLIQSRTDHLA